MKSAAVLPIWRDAMKDLQPEKIIASSFARQTGIEYEGMEDDIDKIDGKFAKVMKAIGAFEELLRSNDEKIEDLKAEFERRNPTQVEKLGIQQANSYPFNVNPNEYWKEKEATSNYSTEPDDNGKEQGQYVITADDVNGDVNWKGIYDSLNDDFLYHQTLDKIVRI